jgi:hypothetical protein
LKATQEFADTAWKATQADKVLQVVNTTLLVHNAMMLSNSLGQTIGEAVNISLQAIGVKDHANQPIDVNQLVRAKIQAMLVSLLGAEGAASLTARIAKANRIYQTGINMLDATRSMFDSAHSIAEVGVSNTGKIGNALKDAGVVAEDSYQEMIERINPQSKRLLGLQKFRDGIELAENAANSVAQISSNVVEIEQNVTTLKTEKAALAKEIDDDVKAKTDAKVITKQESQVTANPAKVDFEAAPPTGSP